MEIEAIGDRSGIDVPARILHLGLILFGLLALATGDFADDYKMTVSPGFAVHKWIGIGVAIFIGLRFMYGIWGPFHARFVNWVPYNRERLKPLLEDIVGLLRFRLPDRQPRQGLAAIVELSGLLLFLFLSVTGVSMFLTIEPGRKAQGAIHIVKELHEAGEILLPLFFLGHGGAVLLHAVAGKHLWRKMIFLKERPVLKQPAPASMQKCRCDDSH